MSDPAPSMIAEPTDMTGRVEPAGLAPLDEPWSDDRGGRLAVVAMVGALLFLLVVGLLWWATDTGGQQGEALHANAAPMPELIAPTTSPATSSLPLSPVPLPTESAVAPRVAVAPPVPVPPPVSSPDTLTPVVAPTTTAVTTTLPATTVAPTTTTARTAAPTTTSPPRSTPSTTDPTVTPATVVTVTTIVVPTTTTAPSTTETPTTTFAPTTTSAPATTAAPPPVVTDQTLLDVIDARPELSRLGELIEMSGVADELERDEPRTLLAPSNTAFDRFAATEAGAAVLADPAQVRALLLRHLVPGEFDEATLFTFEQLETLTGEVLLVDGDSHTIEGAELLEADVAAANGQLHVVSDVLAGR